MHQLRLTARTAARHAQVLLGLLPHGWMLVVTVMTICLPLLPNYWPHPTSLRW